MSEASRLCRVDKFVVPEAAREEFLQRVRETHQILRRQPGMLRDAILEQVGGPGRFNIVTIVEWESQLAIDSARQAVMQAHTASGFDAHATLQRLGIEADVANYRELRD